MEVTFGASGVGLNVSRLSTCEVMECSRVALLPGPVGLRSEVGSMEGHQLAVVVLKLENIIYQTTSTVVI